MSSVKFTQIIFSNESIRGFDCVELSLKNYGFPSDSVKSVTFRTEVVDGQINQALLELAQKHINQNVFTEELKFNSISINAAFLNSLKNYFVNMSCIHTLSFSGCNVHLNQTELEEFICSLKLYELRLHTTLPDDVDLNDKILASVKLRYYINIERLILPRITDNLFDHWKEHPPLSVCFPRARTSFSLKAVTEIIVFAFENGWRGFWRLGRLECRGEDQKYLLELQKIPNTEFGISAECTDVERIADGARFHFCCDYI